MKYLCGRCIHIDVCLVPRSTGCVEECKYFKEMPSHLPKQTNEEWLRTLPAEERVKEILSRDFMTDKRTAEEFVEWLKEMHHG